MEGWDSKTPPFTSKCKEPPSHVLTRERVEIVENSPPSRQNARQRTGGRDWGPLSCILMQGRCKGNPLHQTSCLPPPNLSSATFHCAIAPSVSPTGAWSHLASLDSLWNPFCFHLTFRPFAQFCSCDTLSLSVSNPSIVPHFTATLRRYP